MNVFTCAPDLESILSCIYVAWSSGSGHKNIRIEAEPIEQLSLFDEYTHVDKDHAMVQSVIDAVNLKISPSFYSDLAYISMAYEKDVPDLMYRLMLLGFAYGPGVINNTCYEVVVRFHEIKKRLSNESCRFKEVARFHEVRNSLYVAHIEPKSRIVITLGPAFSDRMPSENWMVIDDVHREAVIHPKNSPFYLRTLTEDEFNDLLLTEKENDEYTDLWKIFFESIAIKERENLKLQRSLFPLWTRKHAVEFT